MPLLVSICRRRLLHVLHPPMHPCRRAPPRSRSSADCALGRPLFLTCVCALTSCNGECESMLSGGAGAVDAAERRFGLRGGRAKTDAQGCDSRHQGKEAACDHHDSDGVKSTRGLADTPAHTHGESEAGTALLLAAGARSHRLSAIETMCDRHSMCDIVTIRRRLWRQWRGGSGEAAVTPNSGRRRGDVQSAVEMSEIG